MNKLKIGIVTAFPPSEVTLNEYGYYLTKSLAQHELVDRLFLYSDFTSSPKLFDFEGFEKIKTYNCWKFNGYFNLFKIIKAALVTKPDFVIINAHFLKFGDKKIPAALGLSTGFFLRLFGIKSIFLIHNLMEKVDLKKAGFTSNPISIALYNFIGNILTRFILGSNRVAVTIGQYHDILYHKFNSKNVCLIPHGCFEPIDKMPPHSNTSPVAKILAFGKFGTYKKVDDLILAFEKLQAKTSKNAHLVIAGTDSPNTPGYLKSVKEKNLHIRNIEFTGYVPENEVSSIFSNSCMVVFPYTSTTGSSGVLHQAGNYGRAVVMPNIDDLAILIEEEGYKGEYFEPNDIDSLSLAMYKLLEDDQNRIDLEKTNFLAANALPMNYIANLYLLQGLYINKLIEIPEIGTNFDTVKIKSISVNTIGSLVDNIKNKLNNQDIHISLSSDCICDLPGFVGIVSLYIYSLHNHKLIFTLNKFEGEVYSWAKLFNLSFLFRKF